MQANDGQIGRVEEVLFDDEHWTVRYLIVAAGIWLRGRKVLIAPKFLGALDWDRHLLQVKLTRAQVAGSPDVNTTEPVSRQFETDLHNYYAWPYYWAAMGMSGGIGVSSAPSYPGALFAAAAANSTISRKRSDERAGGHISKQDRGDTHLRSSQEVTGYGIMASDGRIGNVEDFIVDTESWKIRYLAVDTRDWRPGKKILLSPDLIENVIWPDRTVTVDVTRAQVRSSPEWDPRDPITPGFMEELSAYYNRQRHIPAVNFA